MSNELKNNLHPIKFQSLTDKVEKQLREFFESNGLKPGDAIPKEKEIAANLNVSRNIVREALSRLRMLGMIESRPRKGMTIAKPDILEGIERVLNPFILSEDTLKDIFQLRLIIEMGLAESLFIKKNKENIKELEDIVKKQSRIPKLSKEEEIKFHGKLYEITGNDTLKRLQVLLIPVFDHVYEYGSKTKVKSKKDLITHHDLLKILKNGTPEKFRAAMRKHLSDYFNYLREHSER